MVNFAVSIQRSTGLNTDQILKNMRCICISKTKCGQYDLGALQQQSLRYLLQCSSTSCGLMVHKKKLLPEFLRCWNSRWKFGFVCWRRKHTRGVKGKLGPITGFGHLDKNYCSVNMCNLDVGTNNTGACMREGGYGYLEASCSCL